MECLARAKKFITENKWVFAKTMPENPHEYTVKTKLNEDGKKEFEWFVQYIRDNGIPKKFNKRKYIYLEIEDKHYWTMGWRPEATIIINRDKIKNE